MEDYTKNKSSNVVGLNGVPITKDTSDKNSEVSSMQNNMVSAEAYKKLNRAKNVSFYMHLQIRQLESNGMPLMWIPDIFSYISEDMRDVMKELRERGSFSDFEKISSDDE